ncbi:MAG: hypothetical protein U0271_16360 [Polyangiaceae bacterium]
MKDPVRLFDELDAGASADESDRLMKQLLGAGRDVAPPAAAKAQIWGNLEGVLGAGIAVGAVGSGLGAGSLVGKGSAAAGLGASTAGATTTAAVGTTAAVASTSAAAGATAGATGLASGALAGGGLALGTKIGLASIALALGLVGASVASSPRPTLSTTTPTNVVVSAPLVVGGDELATSRNFGGAGLASTGAAALPEPTVASDSTEKTELAPVDASARARLLAEHDARPTTDSTNASGDPHASDAAGNADGAKDATPSPAAQRRREAELVAKARSENASGNSAAALATLAQLDSEIPRGSLGQERAVLAIEALAGSGQRGVARERARAFIAANPKSPYVARLKPLAE